MNDEVNNPEHYNQLGVEVIEVIEAYELPYHLGNVVKYVLRHAYKGKPLQDLQKAQWYLNRYIEELEATEDCEEWEDDLAKAEYQPGVLRAQPPRPRTEFEQMLFDDVDALHKMIEKKDHLGPGYTEREVEVFFQGYDCRKQEEAEIEAALKDEAFTTEELDAIIDKKSELYQTFHSSLATRIAGEDGAAHRLKDEYYGFNRFEIQGYCASCDAEITLGQPYIKDNSFDKDLKFCKTACVQSLKEWQGR